MNATSKRFLTHVCSVLLAVGCSLPVMADKHSGHGNEGKHKQKSHHENRREEYRREDRYFSDQHRQIIGNYYREEFNGGHCPPGLRKKHNGCVPPGQAKHWAVGRPLPRDVVYYDLPPAVISQIGYPPAGYRYVRVASDILMIAVGTGMVVDALSDLGLLQ